MAYGFQGLVLSEMSSKGLIVLVVKNMKTEVVGVRDIEIVVKTEEPVGVDWPMRGGWFRGGQVNESQRIEEESREDIGMELLDIEEDVCLEKWSSEVGSS